jgi:hypothetical protein
MELSDVSDTVVKACIGFPPAPNTITFEEPTESFHDERPIRPNWAGGLNPISDVEQGVECDWAC